MKKADSRRILIVEDDPDFAASLVLALSLKKLEADIAASGNEGIEKYLAGDYAITVTDIKLPDFDGIEVIRRLKEMRADAPVMVMTGFRDPELMERARAAGARAVMLKPFRMSEVIARVRELSA